MKPSIHERIAAGRANYTTDALLLELNRLARVHRGFRERKVGEWSVELTHTDPVREDSYLRQRGESSMLSSALTTQYGFMATREYPSADFSMVTYNFCATSALDNVALPEHLARYVYGAYTNPLEQAEPVNAIQSVEVHIDTEDEKLHVCQNAKYLDMGGNEIVATCTNMPQDDEDEATAITIADLNDDSDHINMDFFNLPTPLQFRADAALHLEQLESTDDTAARAMFDREFSPEQRHLDLAYFTLRSMKHAMRNIGMDV
ncbi:hypothetical protein GII36_02310 [Candidatus Mycosynbacter amalyticus]|uniref:Uncharacterized protein n=1 Tax=Candidatus Mycosynbacter amalyticus TaxID=2665156 RepID=A0A857MNG5_9BACT|nr:hypothetical protein [Candidatus Mycosynbacter amalyticus]QHN42681.1 hypothetical protein GII36_02310 [Candidatus Mycosynbacter amalyticus]